MDVAFILDKYFKGKENVSIDVFDSQTLNAVYRDVVKAIGRHKLIIKDGTTSVNENGFWQGTLIYMEIGTGEEIDPNQVVDHRADAAEAPHHVPRPESPGRTKRSGSTPTQI